MGALEWCLATGRKPAEEETLIGNEFMRRRGWNDEATETLNRRKRESGLSDRDDIRTMFDYIDADERRPVPEAIRGRRAHCPGVQNSWVIF